MLEKLKEKMRSAKQHLFSFVSAAKLRVSKCVKSHSLSLLDFLASEFFLSAVVIAVKPELLSSLVNNSMEKNPDSCPNDKPCRKILFANHGDRKNQRLANCNIAKLLCSCISRHICRAKKRGEYKSASTIHFACLVAL